jgi:hypothetical protein
MKAIKSQPAGARRVKRHRERLESGGKSRVEVTVLATDAKLVRTVADRLREGGAAAAALRNALVPLLGNSPAKTGAELLAFFRASPLVGIDLDIERDKGAGREISL